MSQTKVKSGLIDFTEGIDSFIEFSGGNSTVTGDLTVTGTLVGYTPTSSLNISNWDTAYGWGNHASAGYLTSFDITTQTDAKYLRSDESDTMSGSLTVTGGLAIDTNTLFVDSVNNRVGIGTNLPSNKLHITGTLRIQDTDDIYLGGGYNGGGYIDTNANNFSVYVNGTNMIEFSKASWSDTGTDAVQIKNVDFIVDTYTFFVDSTNNRIGIGNSSPDSNLSISTGNVNSRIDFSDERGYIGYDASYNLTGGFYVDGGGGANKALLLNPISTGFVGIGTTNPASRLDVRGAGNYEGISISNGSTTGGGYFRFQQNNSTVGIIGVSGAIEGNTSNDVAIFAEGSPAGGSIRFYTGGSGSEKARFLSNGNFGINITNPSYKLHVNGDAYISGAITSTSSITSVVENNSTTTTPGLKVINWSLTTNSRSGIVFQNYDNNGAAIWSNRTGSTAGELIFGTNNSGGIAETGITEKMRISNVGNVGINETNPSSQLHLSRQTIWGTSENRVININNTGTGGNINVPHNMGAITWYSGNSTPTAGIQAWRNTPASGDNIELRFDTAAGGIPYERMRITSAGYIITTAQPRFYARRTTGEIPQSTTIIYETVALNQGSCYNFANGRFTAPIAGHYRFTWSSIGGQTGDVYRYSIRVNDGGWQENQLRVDTTATGTEYGNGERTAIIPLSAGDYVTIFFNSDGGSASYGSGGYVAFMGELIG